MSSKIDITGQTFNRLTVISEAGHQHGAVMWQCQCECGNTVIVRSSRLRNNRTMSCGCLNRELATQRATTHGLWLHPLYDTWYRMNNRCYDTNRDNYHRYGGRGISVYDEWRDSPEAFITWAEANIGHKPSPTHSLDRIDNDGNYEPGNIRWATPLEQQHNKGTVLNAKYVRRNPSGTYRASRRIDGITYATPSYATSHEALQALSELCPKDIS
jgi:hypothetical protein